MILTVIALSLFTVACFGMALLHAVCDIWGRDIQFSMPAGLLRALSRECSSREPGMNIAIIYEHEHYAAVTIKSWGAVVWNTLPKGASIFDDPTRAFTIIPRGTAAYRQLVLHVRYPITASLMQQRHQPR